MTTEELRTAAHLVVATGRTASTPGRWPCARTGSHRPELRAFIAMLDRSGAGYGLRHDSDPESTAVMVEHPDDDNDIGFWVTEWSFDKAGALTEVFHYRGEPG